MFQIIGRSTNKVLAVSFDYGAIEETARKFQEIGIQGHIAEPFKGMDMVYLFSTFTGYHYDIVATSVNEAWERFDLIDPNEWDGGLVVESGAFINGIKLS